MKIDCVMRAGDVRLPQEFAAALQAIHESAALKCCGMIHVVVEPKQRRRSTGKHSQNAHFNGHCQQIAQETGEEMSSVRAYVKEMALKMGYPFRVDAFGRVCPKSEAESTVEECRLLIDAVHELAAYLDIRLIEAEE